jgi:arginine repressor
MTIYGLSQRCGLERTLEVERTAAGVLLHTRDEEDHAHLDRIVVKAAPLLAALIDRPAEQTTVVGVVADREASKRLDFTVQGNEVLLRVRTGAGNAWDIAVGLDDFQDALEQAGDVA